MVEGVEDLGLDGVEVRELVQDFEPGVVERGDRKWLKVQQVCVGWMLLRKDEVLK